MGYFYIFGHFLFLLAQLFLFIVIFYWAFFLIVLNKFNTSLKNGWNDD